MKVVIIGGVAAGASAAARIRRLDEDAEIVILERTGYVSYANCGLPYYVGGVIEDRSALTLQTPESFASRFAVDVRVNSEAAAIDRVSKTVRVRALASGEEYDESYDYLIICTGAKALMPEMGGADDPRVLTLRTVEDCLAMHDLARRPGMRRAVVAGGGYIGLEAAENLRHLGLEVTILQRSSQILPPADIEIAAEAASEMRRNGVAIRYGASVAGFRGGDALEVLLADGTSMEADMAVIALGVVPDTHLARDCGLELGVKGAIPPLVISAAPFIARMVETSLSEVDAGVVEAAQSMGASTWQIMYKVYIPEARPSLVNGSAIAATTILGYSAMSGAVGGGGLGKLAIMYGYNRYQTDIMFATVVLLIIVVQLLQSFGDWATRKSDKRNG